MESPEHQAPPLENTGRFNTRKGRRVWSVTVTGTEKIAPRMMRVSFKGADIDELVWKRGGNGLGGGKRGRVTARG